MTKDLPIDERTKEMPEFHVSANVPDDEIWFVQRRDVPLFMGNDGRYTYEIVGKIVNLGRSKEQGE